MFAKISAQIFDIEKQCGKCKHKTPADAMKHVMQYLEDFNEVLTPYLCPHCSFFHVGHQRFEKPKPEEIPAEEIAKEHQRLSDQISHERNLQLCKIRKAIKESVIRKIKKRTTEAFFLHRRTVNYSAWKVKHAGYFFTVMIHEQREITGLDIMRIEDEFGNEIEVDKVNLEQCQNGSH